MEGSYGPSTNAQADGDSSGQHVTRSSGGAGVMEAYGPDTPSSNSGSSEGSLNSTDKASVTGSPLQKTQDKQPTGAEAGGQAQTASEGLPDPMVAADDGSQAHEAASYLQGRMSVSAAAGSPRSKL